MQMTLSMYDASNSMWNAERYVVMAGHFSFASPLLATLQAFARLNAFVTDQGDTFNSRALSWSLPI